MLAHVLAELIECHRKCWLHRLLLLSAPSSLKNWPERSGATTRLNSPSDRLDRRESKPDQDGGVDRNSRVASWILSQTDARYDWVIYDKLIWVC